MEYRPYYKSSPQYGILKLINNALQVEVIHGIFLFRPRKHAIYTVRQANENKLQKKLEKKSLQSWFGHDII